MEYLLVFFLALGVGVVLWCLFGLLLTPVFGSGTVTLLFAEGDGESLEQTVRAYGWLRDGRKNGGVLLLVDRGLSARGLELAQRLGEQWQWVCLCPRAALEDCLLLLEDTI